MFLTVVLIPPPHVILHLDGASPFFPSKYIWYNKKSYIQISFFTNFYVFLIDNTIKNVLRYTSREQTSSPRRSGIIGIVHWHKHLYSKCLGDNDTLTRPLPARSPHPICRSKFYRLYLNKWIYQGVSPFLSSSFVKSSLLAQNNEKKVCLECLQTCISRITMWVDWSKADRDRLVRL